MMNEICQFTWSRCYLYAGAAEEGEAVVMELWPTDVQHACISVC